MPNVGYKAEPVKSRAMKPGDVLSWNGYVAPGEDPQTVTLKARKDDDSGWWTAEGTGLADYAIDAKRHWQLVPEPVTNSSVVVEEIRRWQADCYVCGWHTREMSGQGAEIVIGELAQRHTEACPARPPHVPIACRFPQQHGLGCIGDCQAPARRDY